MIDGDVLAAEHRVGEGVALANGDRRQIDAIRHIADGVDGRNICARILIDDDRAALLHRDARRLEAEPLRQRRAAGRQQCGVYVETRAILQRRDESARGLLELGRQSAAVNLYARIDEALVEQAAQIFVEAAQGQIGAQRQMHLGAEPREDAGEFDGDIAAADDQQALRQFRQVENLVGGDGDARGPESVAAAPARRPWRRE